jgi:ubiquinol-cytochrome c reductase, iron-sulfur subunit
MSEDRVNLRRRHFLTMTASVVGGMGVLYSAAPFISSMQPSAKAEAAGAPVEIDIGNLKPGELRVVEWRGQPVWIIRRTEEELKVLESTVSQLRDPDSEEDQQPPYARNKYRSIKPEYLVLLGICTHLGCSPTYRPDVAPLDLGSDWQGGFFCPCHGSRFDLAGRVFKGVPAPTNLPVPPYSYLSDTRLLIGVDEGATG